MVRHAPTFMSLAEFQQSSFMSCEKDLETIIEKLFIRSAPYSDQLKRLLAINNKDCLSDQTNADYIAHLTTLTPAQLIQRGFLKTAPKLEFDQHESVKAYIIIEFNSFTPNRTNPEFRDCVIDFNIICHTDHWDLGNYQCRPIKIMGYIDGILNKTKLSGIGTLNFVGANEIVIDENLSGYLLRYSAIHGSDDTIPVKE